MIEVSKGAFCSFCGKSRSETPALLGANTGCFICVGCVYEALGTIEAENLRATTTTDDVIEVAGGDKP